MKNIFNVIFFYFTIGAVLQGQQLVGVSGCIQKSESIELTWALGEIANNYSEKDGLKLSEGVLQSNLLWIADQSELNQKLDCLLSPNPTSGIVHLNCSVVMKPVHWKVYNISGEILQEKKQNDLIENATIDLSNYPAGMYHFEFQLSHDHNIQHIMLIKL